MKNIYWETFFEHTMKIERIEPTEKVKPYLKGLRLPSQFNGKINKSEFIQYCSQNTQNNTRIIIGVETCKRFQDVYNTIAGARLSVALAQIKEFPEFIKPNEWGYNWMRSRYVIDAILLYEASFDLILQIPWIFFQVYKIINKDLDIRKDMAVILGNCRFQKFEKAISRSNLPCELYVLLKDFYENENITISNLANIIKHRQCISFKELRLQNVFVAIDKDYNSLSYLEEYTLDGMIETLQNHHSKLVELCEKMQKFFLI